MIQGIQIVAVVPSGRKRYLSILISYLIREVNNGVIDRIDLWLNTVNHEDIAYIRSLANEHKFIRVVELENGFEHISNPIARVHLIRHFFKYAIDDAIYIRFDDDICYIEPGAITRLLDFRIKHPEYFLVYPSIINNGRTAYLHQIMGALDIPLDSRHPTAYADHMNLIKMKPEIGETIHRAFLDVLGKNLISSVKFPKYIIRNYEKVPINCICWFGSDFRQFGGEVGSDLCTEEEIWLTSIKPKIDNRLNCIFGESIVAHFSFHTQKEYLESTNLLRYYQLIAQSEGNHTVALSKF